MDASINLYVTDYGQAPKPTAQQLRRLRTIIAGAAGQCDGDGDLLHHLCSISSGLAQLATTAAENELKARQAVERARLDRLSEEAAGA